MISFKKKAPLYRKIKKIFQKKKQNRKFKMKKGGKFFLSFFLFKYAFELIKYLATEKTRLDFFSELTFVSQKYNKSFGKKIFIEEYVGFNFIFGENTQHQRILAFKRFLLEKNSGIKPIKGVISIKNRYISNSSTIF